MRKNNGHKTLPAGTPNSKAIRSDKQSPTLVLRNLPEKYLFIKLIELF